MGAPDVTISAYALDFPSLDSVNYTLGLLGIAAIVVGWWRGWWESPRRREQRERERAMHEALLGAPEERDLSGTVTREARPGLVALQRADSERLEKVEDAIVEFRHVLGIVTEFSGRMDRVEADVSVLKNRRVEDALAMAERTMTAASATEALRLIRDRDVEDGESDEPSGEI